MLTTDSPCDVNTMMMVNRKMLDAHKKMVENKLQMEVAHSVTCMSHPVPAPPACHGSTCGQHTCPAAAPHCLVRTPLKTQGSKRFFPHLEQIPEESRNNTARSVANKKAQVQTSKQCWSHSTGCVHLQFGHLAYKIFTDGGGGGLRILAI